jgi:hypothetical protein
MWGIKNGLFFEGLASAGSFANETGGHLESVSVRSGPIADGLTAEVLARKLTFNSPVSAHWIDGHDP